MTVQVSRRPFTAGEFGRLLQHGILVDRDHVELIDGTVYDRPEPTVERARAIDRVGGSLRAALSRRAVVHTHQPVSLGAYSEPTADVVVTAPGDCGGPERLPTPGDIRLIVAIADVTLAFDRTERSRVYVRAGIGEYWIVNIVRGEVIVQRHPARTRYRSATKLKRGDTIQPLEFPDVTIALDDLLG